MKYEFNEIFSDVTKYGKKIPSNQYLKNGKYPIIDQGQEKIAGYLNEEDGLFKDVPAIIFGDHTRILKYVEEPCFLGADGVKLLKSKLSDCNDKFLFYALENVKIPNTGYNRHFKWLKAAQIDIPSRKRQDLIVNVLDTIERIILLRRRELQKLDELVKSRFIEMFGELACNKNNYPIKSLKDIAVWWNGLTYKPSDIVEEHKGILVLRSSNIQNSEIVFNDNVYVGCSVKEKFLVKNNDILMCSRNGSAALVGKCALVKESTEPMAFGAFMMIIRSDYYPYLKIFFQLSSFRRQISTGTTTINQITGKMLEDVKVVVPDLDMVSKFGVFLQSIDKSKTAIQKSLDDLETLKKSLMQQYFA